MINSILYNDIFDDIKTRIQSARIHANLAVNKELILLYWNIGYIIFKKQSDEGWGKGIIPQLSRDIKKEFSESKGFSERNLGYMLAFAKKYGNPSILQQPVAKLENPKNSDKKEKIYELILQIPWGHNIILLEKVKNYEEKIWYMVNIVTMGGVEIYLIIILI